MSVVEVEAAGLHLSRLVDAASAGEEVILSRNGNPVAKLVAFPATATRQPIIFGLLEGQITAADNFDDPLPDDVLADFEGC